MYKLSIIPNHNHEILSPPSPYLALLEKDIKYIEAECPKTSKWYLCKENRDVQNRKSEDCIMQLITMQHRNAAVCNTTRVSLQTPAYEELDEKHYTVSFPTPTKVRLSCGQDIYTTLQGSYLAVIPRSCYLETLRFTISNSNDRLKGHVLKLMDLINTTAVKPSLNVPALELNSIDLKSLNAINEKISLQPTVQLGSDVDYSIYHTTIPVYIVLTGASVLGIWFCYRKCIPKLTKISPKPEQEAKINQEAIYTIPDVGRVDTEHIPAQFTTKVFHSRCSSGGGVTQP